MAGGLDRAERLYLRSRAQIDRGRLDLSLRSLEQASDLLESADAAKQELLVRVLLRRSALEVELGIEDAMPHLVRARELATGLGRPELIFAVDNAAALQHMRLGQTEAALTQFEQAERLVRRASPSDACMLYLNRSHLRLQRMELVLARDDLAAVIRLAHGELPGLEFKARHNLGYLEFLTGNLPAALRQMDDAAATSGGVALGVSTLDKARVLIEAGLSDAADEALEDAIGEFRRGRQYQELAEAELARAEAAILADKLTLARRLAASARSRFRRRRDQRWWRMAELTVLQADLAAGRPASRLIGPARTLAADFDRAGLSVQAEAAELVLCAALARDGQAEEASRRFRALGPVTRTDPIGTRLQHRVVAATLLADKGERAKARSELRRGLDDLSRHQAQFGSIDLQTAAAIHGRRLVELDLALSTADHRPAAVFNAIERGRAVSRRLTAVTPPHGESAAMLAELRRLTELLRDSGDDPGRTSLTAAMRRRISELYRDLEAVSWRAVGLGAVATPAPMAQVHETAAAQGRVVISYCQSGGRWSAVLLGRGRPRLIDLPGDDRTVELTRRAQADLSVLAFASLPQELRQAATTSVTHTLTELDRLLVRPLDVGDAPIVIIPTGLTATLPWGCLPSLRGRPVEVSPTATSWLVGAVAADVTGPVTVTALAGPGIATGPGEARAVVRQWSGQAVGSAAHTGRDATRDQLAAALATDTIVHVAAHGAHVRQNPLFSSLELADGPLFAYEFAEHQVAPHVVLSACELGQATTRPGDEALGLTRVLLQLGTQCVVAGVAQVADDQAGVLMADYHARLAAGADSATALAAVTEHGPYAPFVCFGSSWRAFSASHDEVELNADRSPARRRRGL